jgi:hypothetical protein
MSLELSPEVENAVRERAEAEGLSVNDLLAHTFAPVMLPLPTNPKERVRVLLAKWRAEDNTPTPSPIPTRNGETPTQALFRKWEEEDALMTEEEREQETQFWEEFQESINNERKKAGMRKLF